MRFRPLVLKNGHRGPRARYFGFLAVLLGVLALVPAFAAAQIYENETGVVVRETVEQREIQKTAEESREKSETAPVRKVTYQDILKHPDELALNFQYAQTQVHEGNLLGASTTLERILMLSPEAHKVRLFLGIVLYRLDNATEALRELEALQTKEMPEDLRIEARTYIKKIKRRIRRLHMSIRESVGYELDNNRNAAPSSKKRFSNGVIFPASARISDNSFLNVTQVNVSHNLGSRSGNEIFASFTNFRQEQTNVDSLDIQSFQYDVGGSLHTPWLLLTPRFYAGHIFLSGETFLRMQGGSLEVSRPFLKRRLNVYSRSKLERQDFSGISENTNARERTGPYLELENGFSFSVMPRILYNVSLVMAQKSARVKSNAYRKIGINQSLTFLVWQGHFMIHSLDLGRDVYQTSDISVIDQIRRDNGLRYRFTYGLPLDSLAFGRKIPALLRGFLVTFTYEYFRSSSSITNYTYRNNKIQTMISRKWDF